MTSPRERAQLQVQLRQQQQALVLDLLPVLDALDRAEAHWSQVLAEPQVPAAPAAEGRPRPLAMVWQRLSRALHLKEDRSQEDPGRNSLARQAQDGIRLIRASLLATLQEHGLEPVESLGQPFDPERMRALGQQATSADTPRGTVVQEAIRGYVWQQTLLREAQVLVAGPGG